MKYQNKYSIFIIFLFLFVFKQSIAQNSEDAKTAEWIFNLSYGIKWEGEANISSYTIGIFSSEGLYNTLLEKSKNQKIHNKPVSIIRYLKYTDIQTNHIVFVSKNENAYLDLVYQKLKGKNVLIISDRSKQPEYSIINFKKTGGNNSVPFSINERLAKENNIIISKQLMKIGGNRESIQRIYAETNKKLLTEQKANNEMKNEIDSLKKTIQLQTEKIHFLEEELKNCKKDK